RRKIERYLERLCRVIKEEDPEAIVSYVNSPTTAYLQLTFLDLVCFNVYLESQERFEAYLARLQNIAGDRPLIMSELGLDALRNGGGVQARSLDWQVRTAFAAGCAGVFVCSWADEWYRHGHDVEDWAFGVTRADRSPKPALGVVREALAEVPFSRNLPWPRISVVVCSYNGARTIRDCLDGLEQLAYPDDFGIGVGELLQPIEAVADGARAAAGAPDHRDPGPRQVPRERHPGQRLSYHSQRRLGRPVGAREAEGPVLHVVAMPVPLVGPGEHEHAGASGRERRPHLPVERARLDALAVAQRVEPELAHDERPVPGDILQARQVRLEPFLRLEVDVEAHEVEERQLEVCRRRGVHIRHDRL